MKLCQLDRGAQESWLIFKHRFLQSQDWCIPKSKKTGRGSRRPAWLSRELLKKLKWKKEVYSEWKKGQTAWEDYKNAIRVCKDEMRKAKASLELKLARGVKVNKMGFFNYIGGKRKMRENVSPLLNETGTTVTEDAEKAELLNAFFASVFTAQASPQEAQNLEESEKHWTKEAFPLVEEDQVKEQISELDTHKSMGPDGMYLRVLREHSSLKAIYIIFESSWRTGEVPEDWRKANVIPVFKKDKKEGLGDYRLVSLTSIPGKTMKRLILGIISKHIEEKKAIRRSQHRFTKGKSRLTNLMSSYDGMTGWIDEGRAVDVVYLDFSKAFDTISHSILIRKLRKCGLEEWTVRNNLIKRISMEKEKRREEKRREEKRREEKRREEKRREEKS
ncbi:rna-directed dna polymerase from mobile element jockey-like [Limosa lapponica baueri]|uniref:Rna-directed dna polymerase from mobile element jockey-like n=1 Tax=Limosa lapponica baueri TaxID=1758121 RepID=A0A2I0U3W7_LIMLA|nr:rna-directed dna polymerase from mobile element jockey-like [Limosa lapponica baueri]